MSPSWRCSALRDLLTMYCRMLASMGRSGVVRYGRLVDRKPSGRAGIMHHDLVNAM